MSELETEKTATTGPTSTPSKPGTPETSDKTETSENAETADGAPSGATDLENLLWLDSKDYEQFQRFRLWVFTTAGIITLAGLAAFFVYGPQFGIDIQGAWIIALIVASWVLGAAGALVSSNETERKERFAARRTLGLSRALTKEEDRLRERAESGQLDLVSLWSATQKRISYYHDLATSQAARSFRLGQTAMIVGFLVVIAAGIMAALAPNGTAAIAASVVGVAGAAMSAYVSTTFMKAQAEAAAQLRQFFVQPVEFSRLLGAERLIVTLDADKRAEAVQDVVRALMAQPPAPDERGKGH